MNISGRAASVGAWIREHRGRAIIVVVAALLVLVLVPLRLSPYSQSVLVDMLQYALLALGLNVVVGFAGLLDLGYVAFY
ncbi:MAG TPA: branched-chain amino acid ABC transporter permease, partial [Actinomycetota bacterium]